MTTEGKRLLARLRVIAASIDGKPLTMAVGRRAVVQVRSLERGEP